MMNGRNNMGKTAHRNGGWDWIHCLKFGLSRLWLDLKLFDRPPPFSDEPMINQRIYHLPVVHVENSGNAGNRLILVSEEVANCYLALQPGLKLKQVLRQLEILFGFLKAVECVSFAECDHQLGPVALNDPGSHFLAPSKTNSLSQGGARESLLAAIPWNPG